MNRPETTPRVKLPTKRGRLNTNTTPSMAKPPYNKMEGKYGLIPLMKAFFIKLNNSSVSLPMAFLISFSTFSVKALYPSVNSFSAVSTPTLIPLKTSGKPTMAFLIGHKLKSINACPNVSSPFFNSRMVF